MLLQNNFSNIQSQKSEGNRVIDLCLTSHTNSCLFLNLKSAVVQEFVNINKGILFSL